MTATTTRPSDRRISPVFLGILAVTAVTGWATWTGFAEQPGVAVFLFVTAAWIVSLCLHEYAHARTALHSGDISVGELRFLLGSLLQAAARLAAEQQAGVEKTAALITTAFLHGTGNREDPSG